MRDPCNDFLDLKDAFNGMLFMKLVHRGLTLVRFNKEVFSSLSRVDFFLML